MRNARRVPQRRSTRQVATWWCLAGLLFVVGDLGTTALGLHVVGASEAHPVGRTVLASFGILGILGAKALAIITLLVLAPLLDRSRIAAPATLAVMGLGITAWNLVVVCALAAQ